MQAETDFDIKSCTNYSQFWEKSLDYFDRNSITDGANFNDLKHWWKANFEHFKRGKFAAAPTSYERQILSRYKKSIELYTSLMLWQTTLSGMQVSQKSRNKYILSISNSCSILREEMFSREFVIGPEVFQVEILLENDQSENRKMESFGHFKFDKLDGLFYFMKVKNLQTNAEVNDKITLKESISAIKEISELRRV